MRALSSADGGVVAGNSVSRRAFLGTMAAAAVSPSIATVPASASNDEAKDILLFEKPDGRATDTVFVRRVYLDLSGRLPTKLEAQAYVFSRDPDKKVHLIDERLSSSDAVDYWSLRFADILRVKSEFPINLWPNAVYVYQRRIRSFVDKDEGWDHFARALLTSAGSDFRDPEANFFRAVAVRTPEGFAEAAAQTFLGARFTEWPAARRAEFASYFDNIRVKKTREWKEEIVWIEGPDRRAAFCDRLTDEWRDTFASAFVARVFHWIYGSPAPEEGARAKARRDRNFVKLFRKNDYRLRPLLRAIALSDEYGRGSITGGFPLRRLDAEVLEDAICDLTASGRNYQSIAPEPFTFLPARRRSIAIEDGSITSSFLILFGRPARDSGLPEERHNDVTAKQRLYLFNSGRLFARLGRLTDSRSYRQQTFAEIIDDLYWRFFARAPSLRERKALLARLQTLRNREKWRFPKDLAWCLVNTKEFLFRH